MLQIIQRFQFLHGTIKSLFWCSYQRGQGEFQFLHGTIKSNDYAKLPAELTNFNSFMVQLKVKTVRTPSGSSAFQFLHGTIKRLQQIFFEDFLAYFNSFMVQLKGEAHNRKNPLGIISIPSWYN